MLKRDQLLDAFPDWKQFVKKRFRRAPVDYASFGTLIKACTMEGCRGTCCYDGVCLDEDEERLLTHVVGAHPVYFRQLKLTPENAFEEAEFLGSPTRKTATRREKYPAEVGFPKHFDKTSCVFRFPDGRCSLQSLAMEHGDHPWAYKPISCWLHPISLERDGRTLLWLPTLGNDPLVDDGYPGYAPFTPCGKERCDGQPAYEVLREELDTLGEIAGRDFHAEIRDWHQARAIAS